jgi:hypothetical protein
MKTVSMPDVPFNLLSKILDSAKVKQQPWCQQILLDLVVAVNAYFASEVIWNENADKARYVIQFVDEFYFLPVTCSKIRFDDFMIPRSIHCFLGIHTITATEVNVKHFKIIFSAFRATVIMPSNS